MYDSGLSDIVSLTVDTSGSLLGVGLSALPPMCEQSELNNCHGDIAKRVEMGYFNTTVDIKRLEVGPV